MVPTREDVSVGHSDEGVGLGSYQIRYKGNCHSSREWRHLVHYQVAQPANRGHSGEGVGFGSYQVRCECMPF